MLHSLGRHEGITSSNLEGRSEADIEARCLSGHCALSALDIAERHTSKTLRMAAGANFFERRKGKDVNVRIAIFPAHFGRWVGCFKR